MSADFDSDLDQILSTLDADTERLRLPAPRDLRATGDARGRRQVVLVAGVVVVVLATLAGVGLAAAQARPVSQPAALTGPDPGPTLSGPAQTPPVVTATPSTTRPSTPTPASSSAPPVRAGQPCTAGGLTFVGVEIGLAMGSRYATYTVRNHGAVMCRVQGAPRLRYRGSAGTLVALPGTYGSGGASVPIAPGGTAVFITREVNGLGGYPPGSSQCAHPATYTHVAAAFADGSTLALGRDETITVQCEKLSVMVWQAHA